RAKSFIKSVGDTITEITLVRPSFSSATKKLVNPAGLDLVPEELDRCHVISSHDMAVHYESNLKGKKWAAARAVLDPKHKVESPYKGDQILAAVKTLYKAFFNETENLFLDDATVNRSLGEKVDARHPLILHNANKLKAHIKKMVAKYALTSQFTVSK